MKYLPHHHPRLCSFALVAVLVLSLQGCVVVTVADTAASLAVGTVGLAGSAVVGTARIAGSAIGTAADAVLPSSSSQP
ncbi:MAG: hypothetical protein ABI351_00045 [Herbaspirillum sp.]